MEEPVIPFDVWLIIASFCTPYVYRSLCLTNRTIQQRIRHLKNDFFKECRVIQRWYSGHEMTVTTVDFGEGSDRTDVYIDDNDCISLRGVTNRQCVFKHYAIEWHSFYGVFTKSGIQCIVRPGDVVRYREDYYPCSKYAYFQKDVNLAISQVTRNDYITQDTRDFCAAMLIKNGGDIVATIMALTNNV